MHSAQEKGLNAENRVLSLAERLGIPARRATAEEDYGGKTDVVIGDVPLQVSCQPKSKNQRMLLERAQITNLAAGESIADEIIIQQLLTLAGK